MRRTKGLMALLFALVIALACCPAAAADYDGFCDILPKQIETDVRELYAECVIEDYIEIPTPVGIWGFVLVWDQGVRRLVAYDAEEKVCMLATENAVPQGVGTAFMVRAATDNEVGFLNAPDELGWDVVYMPPDHEGYWYRTAEYHWQDGAFHLIRFSGVGRYFVLEDGLWRMEDMNAGVSGEPFSSKMPTELQEVNIEEAFAWLAPGGAPEQAGGVFSGQTISFEKGQKYPVYTGPGEAYARSGNGKGSVSTNDRIQVFGRLDGWIMIQYAVNEQRCRIGWIETPALPGGTQVRSFDSAFAGAVRGEGERRSICEECDLTDDPFISGVPVLHLSRGTNVCLISGDDPVWAYIGVEADGKTMFGFVPEYCVESQ